MTDSTWSIGALTPRLSTASTAAIVACTVAAVTGGDGRHPRRAAGRWRRFAAVLAVAAALGLLPSDGTVAPAHAATGSASGDGASGRPGVRGPRTPAPAVDPVVEAREAWRRRDLPRLNALRDAAVAGGHPLAGWFDYWALNARLREATVADVEAFYARWPGSYVEDRLRNDWLLELGRRRDWAAFAADHPRFRMADDREVTCYARLVDHLVGRAVTPDAALALWLAQRDADEGCQAMARQLVDDKVLGSEDVWRKARFAVDANRPRAARAAVSLLSPGLDASMTEVIEQPQRWLQRRPVLAGRVGDELATLALMRLATTDHVAAATQLESFWEAELPDELKAWAWAMTAKWAAIRLQDDASDLFTRAARFTRRAGLELDWPDDTLAWKARAGLRADGGAGRWQAVVQAIDAMSPAQQRDPAWVFWKARALERLAGPGDADPLRAQARQMLTGLADPMTYHGQLALEALGQPLVLPVRPTPPTTDEREAAARHPGLTRALRLLELGLRSEGQREWNFSLRGLNDRALLAAAQRACDREVWDRCISTSERTRVEIDLHQRFPTPMRAEVTAAAREAGVDPAFVYGLIRQESRFVRDARSGVGAAGLMQVMPATARWTARKIGLPFTPEMIDDRDVNLRLGTAYLRLVLDDFSGAQALAAAAYNAGPNRARRWREGPVLDAAVWTENIPIHETRDYVRKVLSNATIYAAVMAGVPPLRAPSADRASGPGPGSGVVVSVTAGAGIAVPPSLRESTSLRARLGRTVGPRDASAPEPDRSLP